MVFKAPAHGIGSRRRPRAWQGVAGGVPVEAVVDGVEAAEWLVILGTSHKCGLEKWCLIS